MADSSELLHHVQDSEKISFWFFGDRTWTIWQPFEPLGFKITKFMLAELAIAALIVAIFWYLAKKIKNGDAPKGKLANLLEAFLLFIRDEVARPSIGEHHADRFLPFLWTMFFVILFGNLAGMLPWIGTPNSSLGTTLAYAVITFLVVIVSGMIALGPFGFWIAQVPSMEIPFVLKIVLYPPLFCIEVLGICIKHGVLAIRLFANMFAGHLVLAVILGFIVQTAGTLAWFGVMPISLLGSVAISFLELLVCFIQAYVFTLLAAVFIGMAVHRH
jgi:F-type H+-transporting ATPase subunit a